MSKPQFIFLNVYVIHVPKVTTACLMSTPPPQPRRIIEKYIYLNYFLKLTKCLMSINSLKLNI